MLEQLAPGVSTIDAALAAAQRVEGRSVGGPRHFYMETQRCIVTNAEDGGLRVRSSTQGVAVVQQVRESSDGRADARGGHGQVRAGGAFGAN